MESRQLEKGTFIGRYEVKGKLGFGGFAITYHGWDETLKRRVAIKEYFPDHYAKRCENLSDISPRSQESEPTFTWGLERFLDEGRTLAKFSHPSIVSVIEFIETNQTAYLIMEFVEGQSLTQYLHEKKHIPDETLQSIFYELLDALITIHSSSYLHRDIKPDNIIITEEEKPILIDFGASRLAEEENKSNLTRILTPGFGPIEQAFNPEKQGPWTDLYALGGTMYYCVTGGLNPVAAEQRAVHHGSDQEDLLKDICETESEHYDTPFLELITWMLAINPEDRPQSVAEVLAYLEQAVFDEEIESMVEDATPTVLISEIPEVIDRLPAQKQPKFNGLMISGIVGVLLLSSIAYWKFQGQPRSQSKSQLSENGISELQASIDSPAETNISKIDSSNEQAESVVLTPDDVQPSIDSKNEDSTIASDAVNIEGLNAQSLPDLSSLSAAPERETEHKLQTELNITQEVLDQAAQPSTTFEIENTSITQTGSIKKSSTLGSSQAINGRASQSNENLPAYSIFEDNFIGQNLTGPVMVVIPSGEFRMGNLANAGNSDESPVHTVKLRNNFAISRYEIAFVEYEQYAKASAEPIPDATGLARGIHPVSNVSWHDANAYTKWLSEQTGHRYRLPTEAEWEYVARSETKSKYWWGDKPSQHMANFRGTGGRDQWAKSSPAGEFPVNFFSLYDVLGNVSEWVLDCYTASYANSTSNGRAHLPSNCEFHVARGGSWKDDANNASVSSRLKHPPSTQQIDLGFRIVREL